MKNLLLSASLLLFSFYSKAQSTNIHFGLKAGLNISSLHYETSKGYDSRASFYIGALAHIHASKNFAIQPELMFSGQGAKTTVSGSDYKTNLGYINLPVLVQYMTGGGFRLETGPQIGVLVSAKAKTDGSNNDVDIKDNFKTTDCSWVFGVGYITTSGLGFDARYNLGLSHINEGNGKVDNR